MNSAKPHSEGAVQAAEVITGENSGPDRKFRGSNPDATVHARAVMFSANLLASLQSTLAEIESAGLYKRERLIDSPQNSTVRLKDGRTVINLCANNYLGLADHPEVIAAAHAALGRWGFGMASVRFICGTQTLHHQLEAKISGFLGTEDTVLYPSCFDANGGLFEVLLGEADAVISDSLNHASIIDGVRLCKAMRFR